MKFFNSLIVYFAAVVVYWWFSLNFTVFGITPNVVFACVLSIAVIATPVTALTFGFFWGIYMDLMGTSALFGGWALIYTLMVYIIYLIKKQFDMTGAFSQILLSVVLSEISLVCYQILSLILSKINPLSLKIFLIEPVLNALLMPFVFSILVFIRKKIRYFL
ncbi:MAG: rod shape-determining protein MreD [Elusimicrobia bacterium]|nr:rod shape-determining protein MreD [Elusimicrobiota bacterium]